MKIGKNTTRNNGGALLEFIAIVILTVIAVNLVVRIYKFDQSNRELLKQNANHPK